MLVYSDHAQVDPWIVADLLLQSTQTLSPLIAVQPLYMHPFAVAKMVVSLSLSHQRRIDLNFISGGFPRDLEAFCDALTHDERYERIVEYGLIIRTLLREKTPVSFDGKHYKIRGLQIPFASQAAGFDSMFTISGSSPAGLLTAQKLNARAIQYLRPSTDYQGVTFAPDLQYGARLGIVAKKTGEEAWEKARSWYPDDAAGAEIRKYYTKVSDSVWVKELGGDITVPPGHPYWLGPYQNGHAACPFLVGSTEAVATELAGYIRMGLRTFLVQDPVNDEDAADITSAFKLAEEMAKDRAA